jgi:oligopeptide/dipeptide ABC transporter ATP-binding protein
MSAAFDTNAGNTAVPLLTVRGLQTFFPSDEGMVRAVDGVDIDVHAGECLGVVGESGSGKSVTFASVMGLVRKPGHIAGGSIRFGGRELRDLSPAQMRGIRGREIALTMQDALTALDPVMPVGAQILEALRAHDRAAASGPRERALELLRLVGIPEPAARLRQYPHELSGGMRQRVMIAVALACEPRLLIADEPTSALDVTIQAQILELIGELRRRLGMTVVLITHDLGIVAEHCDRVAVMYAGQVVEEGPARQLIANPLHPYTRGLLDALPRIENLDRPIRPIKGQVPALLAPAEICRFLPRCPLAIAECRTSIILREVAPQRRARCIRADMTGPAA